MMMQQDGQTMAFGGDSNAVFQEALALLDEFYATEGVELTPEPWFGKLEPLALPTHHHGLHQPCQDDMMTLIAHGDEQCCEHEPAASSTASAVTQPRRNRQREELLRLRDEANDLERRLNEMKHRHQAAAAMADAMSPEEREMVALWEKIALRQQSERQRVEVENAKLKDLLASQTRVAQELRRLLEKQMKQQSSALPGLTETSSVQKRIRPLHEFPDLPLFTELLGSLEQAYAQVDAVFAASGLDAVTAPYRTSQLKLDDQVGMRVELMGKRIVPFDMEELGEAIWRNTKEGPKHPNTYFYDEAETPDDVRVRYMGLRIPHENDSVDMRGKYVSRRFVEPDRIVLAWRAVLEPQQYSGTPTTDIRFRESGWVVAKRSTSPGASEIQMFRMISPEVPPGMEPTADWRIYALIDFVGNVIHTQGAIVQQRIENYLLENALKKQMSGSGSCSPASPTMPSP
ncbi:hypothetical protein P43SY_006801 [Pythium insidiosum]|uniref:START domain-containing protein n=1 Tax=Pythium insidiosum TaxID=114742 RepID=A0AAD5Q7I6_PYTIN|nr:hypothetical protein P43SY_006801 [Pythium insidiosum]